MAALEVVKRRLDNLGLGDACLELHSHKTNKREVLQELGRTLQAADYERTAPDYEPERVREQCDRLNAYERALHEPIGKTGVTPFSAIGNVIALTARYADDALPALEIPRPWDWSAEEYARRHPLVEEAQTLVAARGVPRANPLWGVGLAECTPDLVSRLQDCLKKGLRSVDALREAGAAASRSDGSPTTRAACEPLMHSGVNLFRLMSGQWRRDRAALGASLSEHEARIAEVVGALSLDQKAALVGETTVLGLTFDGQTAALKKWLGNLGSLEDLAAFNELRSRLNAQRLGAVTKLASRWEGAGTLLVPAFELSWFKSLLDHALSERRVLSGFVRETHEAAVSSFVRCDIALLEANRARLALEHLSGLPSYGGASGALAMLRREIAKQRRQKPLRRLLREAGRAIQAIKPVFMMSPLSVATFLEQGGMSFDVVIFDEASQVRPVDAFGAILRGKQTIVVGDEKQLPPTSFFDAMTSDEADDDGDGEEPMTAGIQSVLELFVAKHAPSEPLLWHYRSRHHSLIALSNAEFYDNKLMVFPHAEQVREDLGLVYHYLPGAVYGRGRSKTNPIEARAVAEAVLDHARDNPDATLGVAAFSTSQMQAVLDELETIRRLQPEYEGFFTAHPEEPFFVKNLENVQGDERDVIFISVGYGRDASGTVSMNFGPLNQQGGERRLNVLITRARQRCEVFTNLRADDIDLSRTSARGAQALKHFLQYAETQSLDLTLGGPPPTESPFESAVRDTLEAAGHQVDTQVGVASYRIDLAVVDEQDSRRYVLGIECDGAMYHHARSARDRDRLRQAVLEQMGWRLYRIWSTDWYKHPERESQRLLAAVETARTMPRDEPEPHRETGEGEDQAPQEAPQAVRTTLVAPRYKRAKVNLSPAWHGRLRDKPIGELANLIVGVVAIEQPVRFEAVARRLADAADQALGPRVRERIEAAAAAATRANMVKQAGGFLWLPNMTVAPVRSRARLPQEERAWDFVSVPEMSSATQQAALVAFGLEPSEVPRAVGQLLGLGRTSSDAQARILKEIDRMLSEGTLIDRDGRVHAPEGTVSLLEERVQKLSEGEGGPVPGARLTAARDGGLGEPYVLAQSTGPLLTGDLLTLSPAIISPAMVHVCQTECPIQVEELFRRVANAYGCERVGRRIAETLSGVLHDIAAEGVVLVRDGFVWLSGQGPAVAVRNRSNLQPADRRIGAVALEEIECAIVGAIGVRLAVSQADLITSAARALGFMRIGKDVADRLGEALQAMVAAGVLAAGGVAVSLMGPLVFLTQEDAAYPVAPRDEGGAQAAGLSDQPPSLEPASLVEASRVASISTQFETEDTSETDSPRDEIAEAIDQLRDKHCRRAAMDHLRHIGGPAVPALLKAFEDPSVRIFAIVSLAEIGTPAVKPLQEMAFSADPVMAEAARTALDRMRKAIR